MWVWFLHFAAWKMRSEIDMFKSASIKNNEAVTRGTGFSSVHFHFLKMGKAMKRT